VIYNTTHGSGNTLIIILMIIIISISSIGFITLISKWDQRVESVQNDTVNLTGINYTSEEYRATNSMTHIIAGIMPNLVWIMIIFGIIVVLTLASLAMRH